MHRIAIAIPRMRLATQLTLFVVFAVVVSVITAYLVVLRSEQAFEYRKAERRADTLAPALAGGLDWIDGVVWVVPPRDPATPPPPPDFAALGIGHHRLGKGDGLMHLVVRPMTEERRSIVFYGGAPHVEQRAMLLRLLGGAALMLVAATVALSPWWATFLLRHDPLVRRKMGQQMNDATREAFRSQDVASSTLARTYTEYVRLLYDPQERSREFIANVAHELRTPLTLVRSGCEVIATSPDLSERHGRRLGQMIAALDHMDETVRSFLLLAREGDYGEVSRVKIRDLFNEIKALHAHECETTGTRLVIGQCDDTEIMLHREAFGIMLSNLVRNAIRHGGREGVVELSYRDGEVSVTDSGPGIAPEDRERIFLPFFRSRRAAEEGVFGHGLGLAIVSRVCDACGWQINVETKQTSGTTFAVRIGADFRQKGV